MYQKQNTILSFSFLQTTMLQHLFWMHRNNLYLLFWLTNNFETHLLRIAHPLPSSLYQYYFGPIYFRYTLYTVRVHHSAHKKKHFFIFQAIHQQHYIYFFYKNKPVLFLIRLLLLLWFLHSSPTPSLHLWFFQFFLTYTLTDVLHFANIFQWFSLKLQN